MLNTFEQGPWLGEARSACSQLKSDVHLKALKGPLLSGNRSLWLGIQAGMLVSQWCIVGGLAGSILIDRDCTHPSCPGDNQSNALAAWSLPCT